MTKNKKNILILILILIIALLGADKYSQYSKAKNVYTADIVKDRLLAISELSVLKYEYKDIAFYEDSKKLKGFNIPLTKKSLIIVFEGYLKAGVDIENAKISRVGENGIHIALSAAKVTDNVIHEDKVVVYDEKSGLFNPIKAEDVTAILADEKKRIEKEVLEDGFLKEANDKAEKLIESFVMQMGFSDVEVDID